MIIANIIEYILYPAMSQACHIPFSFYPSNPPNWWVYLLLWFYRGELKDERKSNLPKIRIRQWGKD